MQRFLLWHIYMQHYTLTFGSSVLSNRLAARESLSICPVPSQPPSPYSVAAAALNR